MKGRLIAFEGIDGSGTETQSRLLFEHLQRLRLPVARFRYPKYSSPIGSVIQSFLQDKATLPLETETLLFIADKLQDKPDIQRLLARGATVLCDRYLASILAYQGARGMPEERLLELFHTFGLPLPDAIIFLRITPRTSVERKLHETKRLDRFEQDRALLESVAQRYERLAKERALCNWHVINAERPIAAVFKDVQQKLVGFTASGRGRS